MKSFYVTNDSFSWHRLLRRTLQGSEQDAAGKNVLPQHKRMIATNYYGSCHADEGSIFELYCERPLPTGLLIASFAKPQRKDPSFLGMTRQSVYCSSQYNYLKSIFCVS